MPGSATLGSRIPAMNVKRLQKQAGASQAYQDAHRKLQVQVPAMPYRIYLLCRFQQPHEQTYEFETTCLCHLWP